MKPYYQADGATIYHGDAREVMPLVGPVSVVITDPPYGQTSLAWDRWSGDWLKLIQCNNLWCFGSLKMFFENAADFAGWKLAQDIIWEKHNGSSFHADRFRRVHEIAAQFYRGAWLDVYRAPVQTLDATRRTVRRKERPPHMGVIEDSTYRSVDGGPRLLRSVVRVRSEHGRALHPTQKPVGIIHPLVSYSCWPGGTVLDPFMGSGSVLIAAKNLGRAAIGIEISEEYCEAAANRLAQTVLAL